MVGSVAFSGIKTISKHFESSPISANIIQGKTHTGHNFDTQPQVCCGREVVKILHLQLPLAAVTLVHCCCIPVALIPEGMVLQIQMDDSGMQS